MVGIRHLSIGAGPWEVRARDLTGDGLRVDGEEEGCDGVNRADHLAGARSGGNCVGSLRYPVQGQCFEALLSIAGAPRRR